MEGHSISSDLGLGLEGKVMTFLQKVMTLGTHYTGSWGQAEFVVVVVFEGFGEKFPLLSYP